MSNELPKAAKSDRQRYVVEAVEAALDVFKLVAENPDKTLAEVSKAAGLNKSRTMRILFTLESRGFVRQDSFSRWRLGIQTLLLGKAATEQNEIASFIQTHLDALRDKTGETTQFRLRSGLMTYCIALAKTHHAMRVHTEIGHPRELYIGSSKAVLAFSPPDLLEKVLASDIKAFTEKTLTREQLVKQLQEIRDRGYSISRSERISGALAFGAPVSDSDGHVIGCISLLGPEARIQAEQELCVTELCRTAREVSSLMGHSGFRVGQAD